MTPERAADVARDALIWIAGDPGRLSGFLDASGLSPESLRRGAVDPEFLGFVLDFLLAGDDLLLAFCRDAGLPPSVPVAARGALPGGELPNWT